METKNRFDTLLKIGTELNTMHNPEGILDRVMDWAIDTIAAERGFIILQSENKKTGLKVVVAREITQGLIKKQMELSTSIINKVLATGKAVLTYDAVKDNRFEDSESVQLHRIHSIACVPLVVDETILGAIYVDNRANAGRFNNEILEFLEIFAGQAAIALKNAQIIQKLKVENEQLQKTIVNQGRYPNIIGSSSKIKEIFDILDQVAKSEATVLIEGESGTGKELVAKAIHEHSPRNENPFIPIYCGSLSENLLESELFGHKRGAFTGAIGNKPGLFEEGNDGTIFLDEIGDISKNIQAKLLRILQDGELKRVGDTKSQNVNVRVIAATNKDLWKSVSNAEFREDLYYRLNVINIILPPLRDRRDDIEPLSQHFFRIYADKNKKYIKRISKEAMKKLKAYKWPGNIRELENTIERAVIMSKGTEIESVDLRLRPRTDSYPDSMNLKEIEKKVVIRTLQECNGNRTKTAKILGVSRRWLQYQLKDWEY